MKSVSQVTMVAVSLATARDASAMHVVQQAVCVMTSLENVLVNLGSPVNDVPLVRFVTISNLVSSVLNYPLCEHLSVDFGIEPKRSKVGSSVWCFGTQQLKKYPNESTIGGSISTSAKQNFQFLCKRLCVPLNNFSSEYDFPLPGCDVGL